jgi:filamentous hemagglutinin
MLQTQEGALAEVTQTFHQQNKKILHINPSSVPSGINRREFERWKANYWKSRSQDFAPLSEP